MSTLPPMPPRPDGALCSRHGNAKVPRIAFALGYASPLLPNGLMICPFCDVGAPHAGPPVLLDYLRRGHQ